VGEGDGVGVGEGGMQIAVLTGADVLQFPGAIQVVSEVSTRILP
jgi:hypothetical protein